MTEPQISPLARRLAEENSIDWRVIPGTGPESRVIERDILTYLARIMSGEIDPPALPDASEPPAPGGAVPDLSEVSNLAAASAGMAKEGIDLSSLLSGAAPVAAGLVAPMFSTPEPAIPEPAFQAADALQSPPLDFTFSDEPTAPLAASQITSLEQISFGDTIPAAFEAPISMGEPTTSAPVFSAPVFSAPAFASSPAKLPPSDSADAEFEIDLDDLDDAPTALEVTEPASGVAPMAVSEFTTPEFAAPEFTASEYGASKYGASEYSFAQTSASTVDDGQLTVLESSGLTFNPTQADFSEHQADLVLDVDSTSEAPLTIAALEASSAIDDDLVMADASTELETSLPAEAFNLEPVHLEPASATAPIQHDDFELDLIDADELAMTPALESVEPTHFTAPLVPVAIAGGAAAAAVIGGMLTPPLEPVDSSESALPEETISPVIQPAAALEAAQPSTALPSSSVASGFFQGFAVRRHFDAAPLTKMQHELTHALNGREVPLAVFLARAAQRNLHALGTGDVVTLTRLGDTLEPLQASGLHHSFIEAVQSVARATPGTMEGLLILDASSLGADDLVLPGAEPVLTLNVKGEYGHLALSGDVPMGKAADFLGKVALALETPVSLVI